MRPTSGGGAPLPEVRSVSPLASLTRLKSTGAGDGGMVWLGSRLLVLWFAALAVSVSAGCETRGDGPVTLEPGQDLQGIAASSPEGTRFYFRPGVYREQIIYPRNRQEFIGQGGVILNGAMELKNWRKQDRFWVAEGLPPPLGSHGNCKKERELCAFPEDLFVDNQVYERVGSLDRLGPKTWLYEDGRAYLADDPTGRLVELGVTPLAFGGTASGVVLRDLIVEKYASKAQRGAIDLRDARGWVLANVTARQNHGVALYVGSGTQVQGGSYSNNGQLGMGGGGEGATIDGAEIAFNNYAGFRQGWEAGGTKFSRAKDLVVRDTCVHHNEGPGLWTDIDNINVLYEGNTVFSNANDGIKHEISYDAIIRNNVAAGNGQEHDEWIWGAQIMVQNSRNVEVYNNTVEVPSTFGNGISVVHQDRGDENDGKYGPWDAVNNYVHDNTVIYLSDRGQSGVARDADEDWFWQKSNNRFDGNTYVVPDLAIEHWEFNDRSKMWDGVKELAYEPNGEVVVERRSPMQLSCDR
jgi:parallel beta-helix repeat protein